MLYLKKGVIMQLSTGDPSDTSSVASVDKNPLRKTLKIDEKR